MSAKLPVSDSAIFDGDLRNIFSTTDEAPDSQSAAEFLDAHRREIVGRISYWTGESPSAVRQLLDMLRARVSTLALNVRGLEASTLIELTAFGTAVMMNYRNARMTRPRRSAR
jgi:hypothetical protein